MHLPVQLLTGVLGIKLRSSRLLGKYLTSGGISVTLQTQPWERLLKVLKLGLMEEVFPNLESFKTGCVLESLPEAAWALPF